MIWQLVQSRRVLFEGPREQALEVAERRGLAFHLSPSLDEDGKLCREAVMGRGFYTDGTEIPPRLVGATLKPKATRGRV